MNDITIFGKEIIDEAAIRQLENCMTDDSIGVLMPDAHKGYKIPIGGVLATLDSICVSAVSVDIGCGIKAVQTDIQMNDKYELNGIHISKVMDEVYNRISFGMGRKNDEPVEHEIFDKIRNANFEPQRKFLQLAENQLGTVGGGNHFVDLLIDSEFNVWIATHFGSRGLGYKTNNGFIALSQGLKFEDKGKEGDMDGKPLMLDINKQIGQDYIEAMTLAGDYAYAGRDVVVNKVLEILGNPSVIKTVHNHHNFAWQERHFGKDYWVGRKGSTPVFPGQEGFVGSNMMDYSVIVEGIDSEDARKSLYSTVHGAGRILSRTAAAGKQKWVKNEQGKKVPTFISKGLIDFEKVKEEMKNKSIELRGAAADEAPMAYKKLNDVLEYCKNGIKINTVLKPIGVVMAGNEYDEYKSA